MTRKFVFRTVNFCLAQIRISRCVQHHLQCAGALFQRVYHWYADMYKGLRIELFCFGWWTDGQRLTREQVWLDIDLYHRERLQTEQWTFLTQKVKHRVSRRALVALTRCDSIQEHPLLGRVFYHLHPCQTATLMSTVEGAHSDTGNYLCSWLSIVGAVVGCALPLSPYFAPEAHHDPSN